MPVVEKEAARSAAPPPEGTGWLPTKELNDFGGEIDLRLADGGRDLEALRDESGELGAVEAATEPGAEVEAATAEAE